MPKKRPQAVMGAKGRGNDPRQKLRSLFPRSKITLTPGTLLQEFADKWGMAGDPGGFPGDVKKWKRRLELAKKFGRPVPKKLTKDPSRSDTERQHGNPPVEPHHNVVVDVGDHEGEVHGPSHKHPTGRGRMTTYIEPHPDYSGPDAPGRDPGKLWNLYNLGSQHTNREEVGEDDTHTPFPGKGSRHRQQRTGGDESIGFIGTPGPRNRPQIRSSIARLNKANRKRLKAGKMPMSWTPPRARKSAGPKRVETIPGGMRKHEHGHEISAAGRPIGSSMKTDIESGKLKVPDHMPEVVHHWVGDHSGLPKGKRSYRSSEFADMEFASRSFKKRATYKQRHLWLQGKAAANRGEGVENPYLSYLRNRHIKESLGKIKEGPQLYRLNKIEGGQIRPGEGDMSPTLIPPSVSQKIYDLHMRRINRQRAGGEDVQEEHMGTIMSKPDSYSAKHSPRGPFKGRFGGRDMKGKGAYSEFADEESGPRKVFDVKGKLRTLGGKVAKTGDEKMGSFVNQPHTLEPTKVQAKKQDENRVRQMQIKAGMAYTDEEMAANKKAEAEAKKAAKKKSEGEQLGFDFSSYMFSDGLVSQLMNEFGDGLFGSDKKPLKWNRPPNRGLRTRTGFMNQGVRKKFEYPKGSGIPTGGRSGTVFTLGRKTQAQKLKGREKAKVRREARAAASKPAVVPQVKKAGKVAELPPAYSRAASKRRGISDKVLNDPTVRSARSSYFKTKAKHKKQNKAWADRPALPKLKPYKSVIKKTPVSAVKTKAPSVSSNLAQPSGAYTSKSQKPSIPSPSIPTPTSNMPPSPSRQGRRVNPSILSSKLHEFATPLEKTVEDLRNQHKKLRKAHRRLHKSHSQLSKDLTEAEENKGKGTPQWLMPSGPVGKAAAWASNAAGAVRGLVGGGRKHRAGEPVPAHSEFQAGMDWFPDEAKMKAKEDEARRYHPLSQFYDFAFTPGGRRRTIEGLRAASGSAPKNAPRVAKLNRRASTLESSIARLKTTIPGLESHVARLKKTHGLSQFYAPTIKLRSFRPGHLESDGRKRGGVGRKMMTPGNFKFGDQHFVAPLVAAGLWAGARAAAPHVARWIGGRAIPWIGRQLGKRAAGKYAARKAAARLALKRSKSHVLRNVYNTGSKKQVLQKTTDTVNKRAGGTGFMNWLKARDTRGAATPMGSRIKKWLGRATIGGLGAREGLRATSEAVSPSRPSPGGGGGGGGSTGRRFNPFTRGRSSIPGVAR